MTNGTVAMTAERAGGAELTVSYKYGQVRILVPSEAPVAGLYTAQQSIVKPGAKASVIATASSHRALPTANVVAVGAHSLMPTM